MSKHNFILWLFAHEQFLAKDWLAYVQFKIFQLCQGADETFDHMFFQCLINIALWDKVRAWLVIHQEMSMTKRMLRIFKWRLRGNSRLTKARFLATSCMIYLIWQTKIRCNFDGDLQIIDMMFIKVQTYAFQSLNTQYIHSFLNSVIYIYLLQKKNNTSNQIFIYALFPLPLALQHTTDSTSGIRSLYRSKNQ